MSAWRYSRHAQIRMVERKATYDEVEEILWAACISS
jgi:hypothetical protein